MNIDITKDNKKTVKIVTDEGQQWRVHPSHLRSAEKGKTQMESVRLLEHQ